ncbi:right-handed parallel beta-helix repeat-containing protein, partial [Candidatus Micrarchaeota archaeon]|nr:right-handed parallel beta-helix repeat-containing protein [Candidatus Micrarchaeota archaeon]
TLGHNSSNVNSTLVPTSGTTDSSGMVLSYFEDDTSVESLGIQANVSDNTGQLLNSITKPLLTMDCSSQGACVPTYDSNGNWVISGDILCVNVVVPITGSIIIMPGGSLTLRGATVNFSCLSEFGCQNMVNGSMRHFGMYVFGTFNMFDDWTGKPSRLTVNTTPFDCCPGDATCGELWDNISRGIDEPTWKIVDCAPHCSERCLDALPHFNFEAEPESQVTMYNSVIDHVGGGICTPSGDDGVFLSGNNAVVRNMKLTHCRQACIELMGSGNQIINNTIYNTSLYGIDIWPGGITFPTWKWTACYGNVGVSTGKNNIVGNEMFGILGSGIRIEDISSNFTIGNNYIHNNNVGIKIEVHQYQPNNLISSNALMYNSVGVMVDPQCYANLALNVIQFNTGAGVYCVPDVGAPLFNATADFNGDIITRNADNCSTCKRITNWNGRGITVGDDCPYP